MRRHPENGPLGIRTVQVPADLGCHMGFLNIGLTKILEGNPHILLVTFPFIPGALKDSGILRNSTTHAYAIGFTNPESEQILHNPKPTKP